MMINSIQRIHNGRQYAIVLMIGMLLLSIAFPYVSQAAVPKLNNIRVALIVDLPQYRSPASAATISASGGLQLGVREASRDTMWLTVSKGDPIRISADQYMIRFEDTSQFQQALGLYQSIQSPSNTYLFVSRKQGAAIYRVEMGPYASRAEAAAALQSLNSALSAGASVAGNLRWEGGSYSAEEEARQEVEEWISAGFAADLAVTRTDGKLRYAAWIGHATDDNEWNEIKARASEQFPNKSLTAIDPAASYLLKREDLSLNPAASGGIPHYRFHPGDSKWIVSPIDSMVKLQEKSNRIYRGVLEASVYQNRLAIVNEVPFEQYLYSVVGSEMSAGWPAEALKAQAVAARTYALFQGNKFGIAHVVDSTLSQVYVGISAESPTVISAVEATAGEVLVDKDGKLIETLFSSNSGGQTAHPTEVWGNNVPYFTSRPSPDETAQANQLSWYRIMMADGRSGYIRADLLQDTGQKTAAGLPYMTVTTEDTNVRPEPQVPAGSTPAPITKLAKGARVVAIDKVNPSTAYFWIRGPYEPRALLESINARASAKITGPLRTLEVVSKGPSGRVISVAANGLNIQLSYPDLFRTALGGLPSTRFDIDQTGRYTVLGADGRVRNVPDSEGSLYVASAASSVPASEEMLVMDGAKQVRLITKSPQFRFIGYGNGHGLGMSQWGAKGLAEQKYDYASILKYYYADVRLVKE